MVSRRCGALWTAGARALLTACGGQSVLVHQLEEAEANEILVVLAAKGLSADKIMVPGRVVTYDVAVSAGDSNQATKVLVANKLPRQRAQGFKETYSGAGGLIPTKSEEKAKYMMAVQGEIERNLSRLPGIVQVHVSVVQPDRDVIRDLDTPPPPATAAVSIVYNPTDERGSSTISVDEVRALVAASVEDLHPTNVAVVMKTNKPQNVVEIAAQGNTNENVVAAETVFGVGVATAQSARALRILLGFFGGAALIGIGVSVGALANSMSWKRRAQVREAEATATRKARGTQTGVQPSQQ